MCQDFSLEQQAPGISTTLGPLLVLSPETAGEGLCPLGWGGDNVLTFKFELAIPLIPFYVP